MRKYLFAILAVATVFFMGCSNSQSQTSRPELSAKEFSEKISQPPTVTLIDVRTPEEFSKGHLANAKNIDWKANDFQKQTSSLDKSKPVYVYCLSGKRSEAAIDQMRADGFKEVYGLEGGIMKWRAANLPEVKDNARLSTGMTKQQFDEITNSDKLVLVDFYADWCAPCKEMEPYLKEISKDMADKVVLVRINADDNQQLCKELKVSELPVLQLYKDKALTWTNTGFITKEDVLKVLK